MRVAIAGAGAVGRSIARELLDNGHEVLLIDKNPRSIKVDSLPRAEWLLADACEITSLDEAGLERCNVVIAATGDDKVNLAGSLLGDISWPADTALVAILRAGRVIVPQADDPLAGGDELLFVTSEDVEEELSRLLH